MNKNDIQTQFVEWVEEKTQTNFKIKNRFLLVCLDEAIEQNINSKFNGISFYEYYNKEQFNPTVLSSWQRSAKAFLLLPKSNVNMTFREIAVPPLEDRKELLSELSQLVEKCEVLL